MKNKGGNTGLQHSPPLYPAAFTENLFIDSNSIPLPTIKSATFLRFIFKNFGDKVRLARTFLAFNQA